MLVLCILIFSVLENNELNDNMHFLNVSPNFILNLVFLIVLRYICFEMSLPSSCI
jgi:hypothetical protein